MRLRYPDITYVGYTEEEAISATTAAFGHRDWLFAVVVNTLLRLPYELHPAPGTAAPPRDLEGLLFLHYQQAAYTIRAAHDLWRRAHYLEAFILTRHLLESGVQMLYFHRHPDTHHNHLMATSRAGRVAFKTMFEEFAPGGYDLLYGRFLSTFAHGSLNFVFRTRSKGAGPTTLPSIVGAEFDPLLAGLLHTYLVAIVLCLLSHLPAFFPDNTIASASHLALDVGEIQEWARQSLQATRAQAPDPRLIDHLLKLSLLPESAG